MSFFSWRHWIKRSRAALNRPQTESYRKRGQRRTRLFLEQLEDRLAPAAVSWTGNAGTLNWSDPGNWSNNAVPTSSDDVTINISVSGTIIIGSGNYAVRSLNDTTAELAIAPGGTLSLAAVAATSTFGNTVTVQSGGTLTVGAGASVQTASLSDDGTLSFAGGDNLTVGGAGGSYNVQWTIGGTLSFASGDTVTTAALEQGPEFIVGNGGLMSADSTSFNPESGNYTAIDINSGGELQASKSTFGFSEVVLADGCIFKTGDLTDNIFNTTLHTPLLDVPLLTNNKSFNTVLINPNDSVPSGQTLTLPLMGTASTTNLLYVVQSGQPGTLAVDTGAALNVAPGVHLQLGTAALQASVSLTVDGTLSFGSGDTVTFDTSQATGQIVIGNGGLMNASGTLFNAANTQPSQIIVNSGGSLQVSGGSFAVSSLSLNSGSTDTLQVAHFATVINIDSGASLNISLNDFSNVGSNGIVATGSPSSTINLINNYWNTSVPSDIAAKILDHAQDATRPTVQYQPFITGKPVQTVAADVTSSFSSAAQNVTLSAIVNSPTGTVSEGTVEFTVKNGNTTLGTALGTVSSGTASASFSLPAGQALGNDTIVVSYSDSSGQFSDGIDVNGTLAIKPAKVTTTAKNVSAAYSPNAQTVALSALVTNTAISTDTVDEGTVTFTVKNGNTTLGTALGTVSGGTANASFTLPAGEALGSYTIEVGYSNSAGNYLDHGDTSAALTVAAAKVNTTAGNVSTLYSPNAQTLTFNATVTNASIPTDTVDEGTVTFTIKNGGTTVGTAQGTVGNGKATAGFTLPAGQAAGNYTLAVSYSDSTGNFVDSGDTNATLAVQLAPVITTNPSSQTVTAGQNVAFTAAAQGNPVPTVQWQVSTNGGKTFTNINGATSTTLILNNLTLDKNGYEYQAVFTNSLGSVATAAATLTVQLAPVVTTNPSSQTVTAGQNVTFTAAAEGNPAPTVQWQVSTNGGQTFTNINGATSTTLTLNNVNADTNGHEYQAIFTNSLGSIATSAATLTVKYAPVVTSNPSSEAVTAGQSVTFTAAAQGNPAPTVQWQVSTNGGQTFTNINGATSTTLTLNNLTVDSNGYKYQAIFINSLGSRTTSAATLTVQYAPVVTINPSSQTVTAGQNVTFTAAANGRPDPTVQWQVSSDGGKTFTSINGATSTTLTLNNLTADRNGQEYQAVFTNNVGSIATSAATLTVLSPATVTANPSDQTVIAGRTATFVAAASGYPEPTVQWQVSTDGGKTWTSITGADSLLLIFTNVSLSQDGDEYRAVFTNSINTATTTAATLTVQSAAAITSGNSAAFTVGQSGSFTVIASGSPASTVEETGALPSGLTFKDNGNGTATLAGTPASGTQGAYDLIIAAYNHVGNIVTQEFTLTVNPSSTPLSPPPPPPVTTSPSSQLPSVNLNVPPLLALINGFLKGADTINADGSVMVTYSLYGYTLLSVTYDGSGDFVGAALFGLNVPNWVWYV